MKARIPREYKLTRIEQDLMMELAEKEFNKQRFAFMRQIFKMFCYVLNREYGFGKKRLTIITDEVEKLMNDNRGNDIFWEQLDRVVIDEIGMDFVREKTDKDGKAVFTDDDTEIHASKKHT